MTAAQKVPVSGRAGLLEKLMAVVRPEFRVDVLIADPGDPVLGVKSCEIGGCDRPVRHRGLCNGHYLRWNKLDRPELAEFKAELGPPQMGRRELDSCTVPGCR
jgi:hypothetical protein